MHRRTFQAQRFGFALLAGAAGGLIQAQPAPVPTHLTEAETGQRFPLLRPFPGRPDLHLESLGVGHRKLFGVSYYSASLYAEPASLRKALAGAAEPRDVFRALEASAVPLCLDIQYTRGVSGHRRLEVIKERLGKLWAGSEALGKDPEASKLLDFFAREAHRGDESFLWFHPDGRMLLEEAGRGTITVRSPRVRRAIMDLYFGPNAVSEGLKTALFSRMEALLASPGAP